MFTSAHIYPWRRGGRWQEFLTWTILSHRIQLTHLDGGEAGMGESNSGDCVFHTPVPGGRETGALRCGGRDGLSLDDDAGVGNIDPESVARRIGIGHWVRGGMTNGGEEGF